MTMTASLATTTLEDFVALVREGGWKVSVSLRRSSYSGKVEEGSVCLTIERSFTPGDRDAYVAADCAAQSVIRLPHVVTYGSTWGTDSASVGGHAGMVGGYYRLSKSGLGFRWCKSAAKALGITIEER